jgi:hypothetical protein
MSQIAIITQAVETDWIPLIGAKQFRIISMRRAGDGGWSVQVEIFVRDPFMSISNAAGEKEVLRRCTYKVDLDESAALLGFLEVDS